jgi:hypothetical protein
MRRLLADVCVVAGAAAVVAGFYLIHPSAAWLAGGVLSIAVGIGIVRGAAK